MTTPSDATDFIRTHRHDAIRWATALVGHVDIGEDIAHEALIAVSARLDELASPSAYLRRAVVNLCHSWHRSARREERRLQREFDQTRQTTEFDAQTGETLAALTTLPYRQRAAIVLRYWGDWSDDDIAASLGCRPATVRTALHRGLATLRQELAP